ncbi:hypothetical protein TRIP_C20163 [Candidatus Zixiibacteriota bacterium]|nr:hypothetical protein TRIP_C20163 [candidate division Zixibacteria bacterium]
MRPYGKIGFVFLIFLFLGSGCIERVERPGKTDFLRFMPLHQWDSYQYSGPMGRAVVSGNINDLYTFTYYDNSNHIIFWQDLLKTDRGIFWKNLVIRKKGQPALNFEPALPFSPWTRIAGDTLLFSSIEIRSDSVNTHMHIQIEYEIMGTEIVTVPAGTFTDCIKMRMSFKSLYNGEKELLSGDRYLWFAHDVGVVRYAFPDGAGELLSAKVDGKNYP